MWRMASEVPRGPAGIARNNWGSGVPGGNTSGSARNGNGVVQGAAKPPNQREKSTHVPPQRSSAATDSEKLASMIGRSWSTLPAAAAGATVAQLTADAGRRRTQGSGCGQTR